MSLFYHTGDVIANLIIEYAANRKDADLVWRLIVGIPKLGRQSINRTIWYKNFIYAPFTTVISKSKVTKYLQNGKLHRFGDEPAIVYTNGESHWYKNGKLHRRGDLPAIVNMKLKPNCPDIYEYAEFRWYRHGKLHRDNENEMLCNPKPAIVIYSDYNNGELSLVEWYHNDKLHRSKDMYASIRFYDGTIIKIEWIKDGKLHRENDNYALIQQHRHNKELYIYECFQYDQRYINNTVDSEGNLPSKLLYDCKPMTSDEEDYYLNMLGTVSKYILGNNLVVREQG